MVEWQKIKAEYISTKTSYRKLANQYGLTLAELRNVAEKEEWVKLKAQVQHKSNTKIVNAVSEKEAKKAVDIDDVADTLLEKIVEAAAYVQDSQAIKQLSSALKDLMAVKGHPKNLEEQEARIAKLRREAERDEDTTNEVEVVFNAGPGEWNE